MDLAGTSSDHLSIKGRALIPKAAYDPPQFKVNFSSQWVAYLNQHPSLRVPWVRRRYSGEVVDPSEVLGMLALAQLGPAPHSGLRTLHFLFCVARIQDLFAPLARFRYFVTKGRWPVDVDVDDDSVLHYMMHYVVPRSEQIEFPSPEERRLAPAIKQWISHARPPVESRKAPPPT